MGVAKAGWRRAVPISPRSREPAHRVNVDFARGTLQTAAAAGNRDFRDILSGKNFC